MDKSLSFLQELDGAVARGSAENRLRALWHATDLLVVGRYSEDEIWIFGEIIDKLVDEIETAARAKLASKLAPSSMAPAKVLVRLANDQSIHVAGPVLRSSERLDVRALVATANSQGQQHLLAISKRKTISEDVTDVLVSRGNREVIHSVASNKGARFTEFGLLQLIKRSENDSILSEHLGQRRDIPRHLFQQLIAKASENVREKLALETHGTRDDVQTVVADVTGSLHAKFGPASKEYFLAKKEIATLHQYGNLNETKIYDYAQARKLHEVIVALSLLSALPADVIERALADKSKETILLITKALGFVWPTAMSLLFLSASNYKIAAGELEKLKSEFDNLSVEASKKVLDFYRSRKTAAATEAMRGRLS